MGASIHKLEQIYEKMLKDAEEEIDEKECKECGKLEAKCECDSKAEGFAGKDEDPEHDKEADMVSKSQKTQKGKKDSANESVLSEAVDQKAIAAAKKALAGASKKTLIQVIAWANKESDKAMGTD